MKSLVDGAKGSFSENAFNRELTGGFRGGELKRDNK
jgi:hypothetical protein